MSDPEVIVVEGWVGKSAIVEFSYGVNGSFFLRQIGDGGTRYIPMVRMARGNPSDWNSYDWPPVRVRVEIRVLGGGDEREDV